MNLESSIDILKSLKECAISAKIQDKMFLGFGTLLGAIRERSIIEHDTDLDVCFLPLTPSEKERYYAKCNSQGLLDGWPDPSVRIASKPTGEILWFSAKKSEKATKCCNWFFEEWAGNMWHTKGKLWTSEYHFDRKKYDLSDDAVMKGAPANLFKKLTEVDCFAGKFNYPLNSGELLDFWYPHWIEPRYAEESTFAKIARVGKWYDKNTWSLI